MDRELQKELVAFQHRKNKTGGFQGCKNFREKKLNCTFDGFYLASYSQEGFCLDCELKTFPDRFVGCHFCGRAQKYGLACGICENSFIAWGKMVFSEYSHNANVDGGLWEILKNDRKLSAMTKPTILKKAQSFDWGTDTKNYKWPGFFNALNEQIVPNPLDLRKKYQPNLDGLTWDNRRERILGELQKMGIVVFPVPKVF